MDLFRACLILEVSPDSSESDIRRAYRRLARQWHPDRIQDPRRRSEAERRIREINAAHEMLTRGASPDLGPDRPGSAPFSPAEWAWSVAEDQRGIGRESAESFYLRAFRLHAEGMEHFRASRYREAISCLTQTICLVQNNPEALRTLGRCFRRTGALAKAAAAFEQALRLDPGCADTRYELAVLYIALGDLESARREWAILADSSPELADLLTPELAAAR